MPEQILSALLSARGILYIILFFGGSIFVHELGHFLAAKSRGLKVERFSIGFGPKIFGWKRKETEYRISLLPLGGYVAIPQLADMEMIEGKTEDGESVPAKPLSYTDKVVVFAAGAFFNVLFAVLCAVILWIAKTPEVEGISSNIVGNTIPKLEVRPGVAEISPAVKAGILPGDRITEIDGVPVESFKDITMKIATGTRRTEDGKPAATLKILRGEKEFSLEVFPELVAYNPRSGDFVRTLGIEPMMPLIVSDRDGKVALPEGFLDGDRVLAITLPGETESHRVYSLSQFAELLEQSDGKTVSIAVARGVPAQEIKISLT
ncbi:MAG: site-2 protease family protein, partial [Opitutales bacterium]|nr:site-2 protease family protein [Opitutales bacterium]